MQFSDIRAVAPSSTITTILLLMASFAQAQTDSSYIPVYKNALTLTVGALHSRIIDEAFTAAKLKFTGTITAVQLNYQRRYDRTILLGSVYGAGGKVSTTDGYIGSSMEQYNLSCSFLADVLNGRERTGLFVGGELSTMAYIREDDRQLNNISGVFIHGLYFHIRGEYSINRRHKLETEILLPGLLFIKRGVADGGANIELVEEADEPMKLVFGRTYVAGPNPATYFRYKLGYAYQASPRIHFIAAYSFSCVNEYSNGELRMYNNQLLGGLKFLF